MALSSSLPVRVFSRLCSNGAADVTQRIARHTARWIAGEFKTAELDFPLLASDIADSTRLAPASPAAHRMDGPLHIAWLCVPPSPGSGGHTTLFRMIEGLEKRGHRCTILLYNRHGSELSYDSGVIRTHWPQLSAEIRYAPSRITGYDACVASSWETAHVLASRGDSAYPKFYFIQDYEPFFYPHGSLYALAEDTYRFGFRHLAVGRMVQEILRRETGASAAVIPFGCDTDVYKLENVDPRSGVVFFTRPYVDRRGFMLGKLALAEFHRRHPEQPITAYGDPILSWDVPHRHAGRLSPAQLNLLYNQSAAGLAMSFTNVSLVPEEMLAAGMRPVVNESPLARMGLSNENIIWAAATPGGLADALSLAVERPLEATDADRLATSVRAGWGPAQCLVAKEIEEACIIPSRPGQQKDGMDGHRGQSK